MWFLLAAYYFCVPLVFSHLGPLLHIPVIVNALWNYEGLKLAIAGFFLALAVLWRSFFSHPQSVWGHHAALLLGVGGMGIPVAIHVFLGAGFRTEFFGTAPFFSGWGTLVFVAGLAILLSQLNSLALEKLRGTIWLALVLAGAYALVQGFGFDPVSYGMPFGEERVFSTLGNPNSFAIYLLLHFPLLLLGCRSVWKWPMAIILLVAIAATGSFSILFLAAMFCVGAICYAAGAPKWWYGFCFLFLGITGLQWFLLQVGIGDKYFSIMTRLAIWQEWFRLVIEHPSTLLWWMPQTDIVSFLNNSRSESLLRYVPAEYALLHFHNAWLDILAEFGLPVAAGASYGLARWYRKIRPQYSAVFLCTLAFFVVSGLFHHLEISHWSILCFSLFAQRFATEA